MSKRGLLATHHLPSALTRPYPPTHRPRPNWVSQQQAPACATWGMPGPGPSGTQEDSHAASTPPPQPPTESLTDTVTPLLTCSWEAGLGAPPQEGLGWPYSSWAAADPGRG